MDHHQKSSAKSKNTILKYLPKPTSSVSFQNPPIYSPSRDRRSSEKPHKSALGIGFSGPMVSMILADTRRNFKNTKNSGVVYEPTSPRVSCMGQVKCKNKKDKPITRVVDREEGSKTDGKSKKKLGFKKIFSGVTVSSAKLSDSGKNNLKGPVSLSAMKRFSSGRDKFSGVDWRREVAAMDSGDRRYGYKEEEEEEEEEEGESDSDDEHVVVPSSAPVIIRDSLGFDDNNIIRVAEINVEPRNEINLWKRRTMQQPKPLQLHPV